MPAVGAPGVVGALHSRHHRRMMEERERELVRFRLEIEAAEREREEQEREAQRQRRAAQEKRVEHQERKRYRRLLRKIAQYKELIREHLMRMDRVENGLYADSHETVAFQGAASSSADISEEQSGEQQARNPFSPIERDSADQPSPRPPRPLLAGGSTFVSVVQAATTKRAEDRRVAEHMEARRREHSDEVASNSGCCMLS